MSVLFVFLAILATMRVNRLITSDSITQPLRDRLQVAATRGDEVVWDVDTPRIIHRHGKLATTQRFFVKLTDCDWCASVWAGAMVAPLAWFLPAAWFVIPALALSASYLTGVVALVEIRLQGDHDH